MSTMSAYKTYVMGADAFFDGALHDACIQLFGSVRRNRYLSTWRMLHIDGFEEGFEIMRPLPARTGKTLQFYSPMSEVKP